MTATAAAVERDPGADGIEEHPEPARRGPSYPFLLVLAGSQLAWTALLAYALYLLLA
jgi:hypothetical protein